MLRNANRQMIMRLDQRAVREESRTVPSSSPLQAGIESLLVDTEGQAAWASRRAARYGRLATQLGIGATVLAAAATLTALPDSVSKWVTAVTAFVAALVSGIGTTLAPQDKARAYLAQEVEWRELHNNTARLQRRAATGSVSEYGLDRELERLEWQRDNLRRKAVGLDPLPEPAMPAPVG